jgi:hypothetical protein
MSIDQPFEENQHTKSARNLFDDLPKVGMIKGATKNKGASGSSDGNSDSDTLASERDTPSKQSEIEGLYGYQLKKPSWKPDYSKGLLHQLWNANLTYEEYVQFIEEPKHLINPVRDIILFNNWFLELFTRTPWFLVPIIWIPLLSFELFQSDLQGLEFCLFAFFGLALWTIVEYSLHRFFFHGEEYWLPASSAFFVFHFCIHGIHHAFPQDHYRLVFPPIAAYLIK